MTLLHADVCSGIGGFSLAAEAVGYQTVLHCEIVPFCRRVLAHHWPEVPVHDDIRTLTAAIVHDAIRRATTLTDAHGGMVHGTGRGVAGGMGETAAASPASGEEEVCDSSPCGRLDLLTGGIPCQPFSVAGKRRGAADDRHLWPAMRRLIGETRPTWVCLENVAGFVSMALDGVAADLEATGYEVGAVMVPAAAVGAPHLRDRIFVVAHTPRVGCAGYEPSPRYGGIRLADRIGRESPSPLCRVDDGFPRQLDADPWATGERAPRLGIDVPDRVKRLEALGNTIVPQQAAMILAAIAAYEKQVTP